jgi:hypothetical protein
MAGFAWEFPKISHRFYLENNTLPSYIKSIPFDNRAYIDTVQLGQVVPPYYQLAMFNDRCTFMASIQTGDGSIPIDAYLLDAELNEVTILSSYGKGTQEIPTHIFEDGITPLQTTLWSFTWNEILDPTTDSGIYYIRLKNTNGIGQISYAISEPFRVYDGAGADIIVNTMIISGSYDTNQKDVIVDGWEITGVPVFSYRVESRLTNFTPEGFEYAYLTQNYSQLRQLTNNWRTWKMDIGHKNGIPDYMIERMAYILQSDNITVDLQEFQKLSNGNNIGAIFEIEQSWSRTLKKVTLRLLEKSNRNSVSFNQTALTIIGGVSGSFAPFSSGSRVMFTASTYISIDYRVFEITTDIDDCVTELNALRSTYSLTGTFGRVGNDVIYTQGAYENFRVTGVRGEPSLLTKFFDIELDTTVLPNTIYSITTDVQAAAMIQGETGTLSYPYEKFQTKPTHGTAIPLSVLGQHTVRFFYSGDITRLGFTEFFAPDARLTTDGSNRVFNGELPVTLETLTMVYCTSISLGASVDFDISSLINLQTLYLGFNGISSFSPSIFNGGGSGTMGVTCSLKTVTIKEDLDNSGGGTTADDLLNAFFGSSIGFRTGNIAYTDYSGVFVPGTFDVRTTGGLSPVTAASANARTNATTYGWTVFSDP